MQDIDEEKLRWFLKEAKSQRGLDIPLDAPVDDALMRLKLLNDEKPNNAALLLFGNEPDRFFTKPEIKCVRFRGTGVTGEMTDFKVIRGNLFGQLEEAERFVYNNIAMAAWIENGKLQRQEKWEYPPKAIREALANAFCHRGYETTSGGQIRIFDDRMEIWNPGRLPSGWTVETLRIKHESMPPNHLLTEHFFWVKYAEEVGTGTNKLIDWCSEWGLPEPDFEFTGTSMIVTFRKSKITEEHLNSLGLNERQKKAIELIKSREEIVFGDYKNAFPNAAERTLRKDLEDLVALKIFRAIGEKKGRKYKL